MKRVIVEYFQVEVTQPNMLLFQVLLKNPQKQTTLQFVFRQSTEANDAQRHGIHGNLCDALQNSTHSLRYIER